MLEAKNEQDYRFFYIYISYVNVCNKAFEAEIKRVDQHMVYNLY